MKRLCFALAAALLLACASQGAYAQTLGGEQPPDQLDPASSSYRPVAPSAGCDHAVHNAMARVAAAVIAADQAMMDQSIDQPASTLMQTCFNQGAGNSATEGGNIFSGDFMPQIVPIVQHGLDVFYDDFNSSIGGFFSSVLAGIGVPPGFAGPIGSLLGGLLGGTFGPSATALTPTYSCEGIEELWKAIADEGIQSGIAYPAFIDLLSGVLPTGSGQKYQKAWQASVDKGAFANARNAMNALPKPVAPVPPTGRATFCSTLIAARAATICP